MTHENGFIINKTSLASVLMEHYIPSLQKLVPLHAFRDIIRLTQHFPCEFSSFVGYEIQLSKNEPAPDFLFCVHDYEIFKKVICKEDNNLLDDLFDSPIINRLKQFALLWEDETSGLKEKINNIWFEFDHADLLRHHPKPNFFFGPKLNSNMLEVVLTTQQVFRVLYDKEVSPATLRLFLESFRHLNGKGFISQIGMMNARNDEHLRLFIQQIPYDDILPFLKRIGFRHSENNTLSWLLNECRSISKHTDLDIDILEKPGENIGLEFYFGSIEYALAFLDKLMEFEACTRENHKNLKEHLQCITPDKNKSFQHFFSHFKVVFKPETGFVSKAYLGYASNDRASQIIKTKPITSYRYD